MTLPSDRTIARAVSHLREGELVAFPTETVYGLGADASNAKAIAKLYAIKGRPAAHPVIVHLASTSQIGAWAIDISTDAQRLLARFCPGPLTLILKRDPRVPALVSGGQDTIGLRFPRHPVAQRLLQAFGGGIAAPSANRFGRISATTAGHVAHEFGADVPLILDGGPCDVGIESTIVDMSRGRATLLRPGGIPVTALADVLGYAPLAPDAGAPRASGGLPAHYAPVTSARRVAAGDLGSIAIGESTSGRAVAVLARVARPPAAFDGIWKNAPPDAESYAQSMYAEMRLLDAAGIDLILIEAPPDNAEWQAVNDRLRRATHETEARERAGTES